MTTTSMADPNQLVTLGIDTHAEVHAVAALDERGRLLDSTTIPTSLAGFQALLEWAASTASGSRAPAATAPAWRAGCAPRGLVVIEVDRPDRGERRRRGKSDAIDAEIAARAVQSGRGIGTPKAGDGQVEAIRALRIARGSTLDARSRVANQLHALRITAPDQLRGLSLAGLSLCASRFRGDVQLAHLVAAAAPQLVARPGIGTQIAGQLLVTAGDNPDQGSAAKADSDRWSPCYARANHISKTVWVAKPVRVRHSPATVTGAISMRRKSGRRP